MRENEISSFLLSIGEPYAAGLFEAPEKSIFHRHCRAMARWYRAAAPAEYRPGQLLYPCGNLDEAIVRKYAVRPQYCKTYEADLELLERKCADAGSPEAFDAFRAFWSVSSWQGGWTHGAPRYDRILREGLDSYRERILANAAKKPEKADFYEGLLLLLDAMKDYAERSVRYLRSVGAPAELVDALTRVPFRPARTYYEGLVAWNAVFYYDFCDNLGCFDRGLEYLYRGEDLTNVISQLFANVDATWRWSCNLGPECGPVTRQALRAGLNRRRPLLALRVGESLPDDVWQLAAEALRAGGTNPSFYNDRKIHDMLHARFPRIPEEDLARFCTAGCTETNLDGLTRAGGTDGDVNLLAVFSEYLHARLPDCESFEDFFEGACRAAETATDRQLDEVERIYRYHAEYLPLPTRTLFFDDCIDKGLDYNAGGARYSWTMTSESGLINVIDSLAAVKKLVYEDRKYSAQTFLALLDAEDPVFHRELLACPCFGTDQEAVDRMGAAFARRVCEVYHRKKPTLEFLDGFLLTEHQFLRYEGCGACVGPTPDGRSRGQATCDSVGALRGKAAKGPTAVLRSAARLPQERTEGISVLNLTLSKKLCADWRTLKSLVEGYFALGGVQLQFTVTSTDELKDAMAHPERHADLLVRVGGYSDYFTRLTPGLRQAVLERNVHDSV